MENSKVKTSTIYKFLLPGFLMFVFALIVPLIFSLGISFTNWKAGAPITFAGLDNYIEAMNDKYFWKSFINNLKFIGVLIVFQIGLAYIFALFIQNKYVKMKEFHRKVIFLPAVLSPILVGLVWKLVYNVDIGLIANVMKAIGLGDHLIYWLDDPKLVILSICLTLVWQYVGQFSIIIMAGMQNINTGIIEAAEIDGASAFQKSWHVILPNLKSTLFVCLIICISGVMKMFDIIYVMTGGGPGSESMVTALYAFQVGTKLQNYSYSATLSICIVVLSLLLITLANRLTRTTD